MNSIRLRPLAALSISLLLASPELALAQGRQRTVTGQGGGSFASTRQVQPSGNGTFNQSGTYTTTTPNGNARSGSFSGSGSLTRTSGQGLEQTSATRVITPEGRTFDLDHNRTTTIEGDGLQQTRTTTVTDADGKVVGTSNGSTTLNPTGAQNTSILSGPNGRPTTVESTITPAGPNRFQRSTTVTNDSGHLIGGSQTNSDFVFVPGQGWTRRVQGSTNSGQPIDRTITNQPLKTQDGL